MLTFVLRRLFATLLVLVAASFIVYVLTAQSGDPLAEFKGSRDPNAQALMEERREKLNLDTPAALRWVSWLGGAAKCLIGQCDLGTAYTTGYRPVTASLATAIGPTFQLVTLASVIAIILGVAVGMSSAVRQYSGYDYTVTFISFVIYSLPTFWVAVLLKEWGAIRLNEFMQNPAIPIWGVVVLAILSGLIWQFIIGGDLRRRGITFLVAGGVSALMLSTLVVTGWFSQPSLGPIGIAVIGVTAAVLILLLTGGLKEKKQLLAMGIVIAVWLAIWYPLQFLFFGLPNPISIVVTLVLGAVTGWLSGFLLGGEIKRTLSKWTGLLGLAMAGTVLVDRVLQTWAEYEAKIPLSGGVIPTLGATTPNLNGDMWISLLDSLVHLVLPTLALTLISFASYTRYARSSLLEVLNQDYVRTARAKGLTERVVILRHAFRNAMIPIATIIVFDFGGLIGGAVITEKIFGWQAMGTLFSKGLEKTDVNLVMGFFLITGALVVVFNILADLLYSALDPRIRVK